MPPEDTEVQPAAAERAKAVAWIGGELEKAQVSERVQHLLSQFASLISSIARRNNPSNSTRSSARGC